MTEPSKVANSKRRKPQRAAQLGITDDEYARLLAAQDGHCALCENRPKSRRLHVDHDHATGRVRGLLCHRCNRNLPTWVDASWLGRAMRYITPPSVQEIYDANWRTGMAAAQAKRRRDAS